MKYLILCQEDGQSIMGSDQLCPIKGSVTRFDTKYSIALEQAMMLAPLKVIYGFRENFGSLLTGSQSEFHPFDHEDLVCLKAKKAGLRFETARFTGNASATIEGTNLRFMLWEDLRELLYSCASALAEAKDERASVFEELAASL